MSEPTYTLEVFQGRDGAQVLVRRWSEGTVEASVKMADQAVWGAPMPLIRTEGSDQ